MSIWSNEYTDEQVGMESERCLREGVRYAPLAFKRGSAAAAQGRTDNPFNGEALRLCWFAGYAHGLSRKERDHARKTRKQAACERCGVPAIFDLNTIRDVWVCRCCGTEKKARVPALVKRLREELARDERKEFACA